jgi:hypothetical protein
MATKILAVHNNGLISTGITAVETRGVYVLFDLFFKNIQHACKLTIILVFSFDDNQQEL